MKLEDYNKNTFSTPDGYFEKLNNKIKSATCYKNRPKAEKRLLARIMSYAAMIAIVFLVAAGYIYNRNSNDHVIAGTMNIAEQSEALYDAEFITRMLDEYPIDEYTFYCYMTNTDNNY